MEQEVQETEQEVQKTMQVAEMQEKPPLSVRRGYPSEYPPDYSGRA
jgi:hypothetical protein